VGGVLIPAIRFADDQAMVSHNVRRTAGYIREVQRETVRINTKKTKIMRMSTIEKRTKFSLFRSPAFDAPIRGFPVEIMP